MIKKQSQTKSILYVGGFELPDKNAAAQRVVSIAKGFRDMGHSVTFINYAQRTVNQYEQTEYFGFVCYEFQKRSKITSLYDIADILKVCELCRIDTVIAYNFPAMALWRLLRFCRNKQMMCYADATEWYAPQGNLVYRLTKFLDTECRMRLLHPKTDGVIAISRYLYRYYDKKVKCVLIPPLVDGAEDKWAMARAEADKESGTTTFVYAGSPSAQKEKLDLIVQAMEDVSERNHVKLVVAGLTHAEFLEMYQAHASADCVHFLGRLPHRETLRQIGSADWSIIIRDNNKVVQAGFPTKLVESISCGVPVIVNDFSNVLEYLDQTNSIVCKADELSDAVEKACGLRKAPQRNQFDYHRYLHQLDALLSPGE